MDEKRKTRLEILRQLRTHCETNGITNKILAERIGWKEKTIENALNGKYSLELDDLIILAQKAKCKIVIENIKNLKP